MSMQAAYRMACALGVAFCSIQAGAADKPYEFGVFPNLPLARVYELHAPMASEFEAKLGRPVRLSSKAAYSAFADDLRNQTYDIALVQPFDYVDAHDQHGYLPLARRGEALEAVIVVRQDSPLASIKDLKGRIISNPRVGAAVARVPRMALGEAGSNPETGIKRYYGKNPFACLQ